MQVIGNESLFCDLEVKNCFGGKLIIVSLLLFIIMARVKNGLLIGSIDGITFTSDSRGQIAKKKSTVSPERIKNHPNSEGTREGMREMSAASMAAKNFRMALQHQKHWMDRYFSGRLSGAMRRVTGLGEGERGKRKLDIRRNGDTILTEVEFREALPMFHVVGGDFGKAQLAPDRQQLTWTSPLLNRVKEMTPPPRGSHFKWIFGVVGVSSYTFDSKLGKYRPDVVWKESAVVTTSPLISLREKAIAPQKLSAEIENEVPEAVGLISFVGIEFWWEINRRLVMLEEGRCMKILGAG